MAAKDIEPKLIVVLERACLETAKVGNNYELLNCDDHKNLLQKHKRDPADHRPDIAHQCLLTLLDSPLNKAGLLKVYIHTERNVLIEVNPHIRIPRTFKRFCGLFVQLLHKLSIRASNGPQKLLQVIKNPITDHLPANSRKIGTSVTGKLVNINDYVAALPDADGEGEEGGPIVFFVGAMAHGHLDLEFTDEQIAISQYPLSGAAALGRICHAFESKLGVL